MKTPRFYLDTSVFGGYFDTEFAVPTRRLFEDCKRGLGIILVSDIVVEELAHAPRQVRDLALLASDLPVEAVQESAESVELADAYLTANVLLRNHYDDCRHVALASVARADVLISWNFRHIVRFDKIRAFVAVNLVRGYAPLEIRSPLEVSLDES
jgi:predicted nucleic acid-binding protein